MENTLLKYYYKEVSLLLLHLSYGVWSNAMTHYVPVTANSSVSLGCIVGEVDHSIWLFYRLSGKRGVQVGHSNGYRISHIVGGSNFSNFDLHIPIVMEEMEGRYECQEQGLVKVSALLMIEVPAALELLMNNASVGNRIRIIHGNDAVMQCVARGAKPAVTLRWKVNGEEQNADTFLGRSIEEEGMSVINLLYRPNIEDTTITCSTDGQSAIPPINISANINVEYRPICNSHVFDHPSAGFFTCQCVANPEAVNISILANGSTYTSARTTIPLTFTRPVELSCLAVNSVGISQSNPVLYQPQNINESSILFPSMTILTTSSKLKHSGGSGVNGYLLVFLLVLICLLCLVALLILFAWRKLRNDLNPTYAIPNSDDVSLSPLRDQSTRQERPLDQVNATVEYARQIRQSANANEDIYNSPYDSVNGILEIRDEAQEDDDGYLKAHKLYIY